MLSLQEQLEYENLPEETRKMVEKYWKYMLSSKFAAYDNGYEAGWRARDRTIKLKEDK